MFRPRKLFSILTVEDNVDVLRKIKLQIGREFSNKVQILEATTLEGGKDIIKLGRADASIVDLYLPDGNGADLLPLIQVQPFYLPTLVQTIEDDKDNRLALHDKYDNITYINKKRLLEELPERLRRLHALYEMYSSTRLAIPIQGKVDSLDINRISHVTKYPYSNDIEVRLHNLGEKECESYIIPNMALVDFMARYNNTGYFLRCHNSFIVNIKSVKSFSRTDNEITMIFPENDGSKILIPVGNRDRNDVLEELKGLY